VLCIEFVELSAGGDAGAVADESVGALGDVDCCLEQATIANALRHNKRRLRFMEITSLYVGDTTAPAPWQCRVELNAVSQAVFHPVCTCGQVKGKLQVRLRLQVPDMLQVGATSGSQT
jgi:hypothetical protein